MLRIIAFFVAVALIAWGLAWLADRPGEIVLRWQGLEVVTTVFHTVLALVGLLSVTVLFWSLFGQLLSSPGRILDMMRRRKQSKGLDALSTGIIAVGAGDRELAARYAQQARRALPHEPLTDLLRAQAAQLAGDKATAHRIFEAMLGAPDTEMLGLRGLFLEAREENAPDAARQFAERALEINPKIDWPVNALFEIQCKDQDWDAALDTLALAKRHGHIDKKLADRRRAVILAGQAQELEDGDMDTALTKATEAHKLAPDLVPAAAVAGRILASKGQTRKLAKVVTQTWRKNPHPDLARVYAFARPGDAPRDRVTRVKELAGMQLHSPESPIAVAKACIEARDFAGARSALKRSVDKNLTQRVCALMAQIESGEHGDRGRVREWLARAVTAQRDPAWTADGHVAQEWAPVSPVTGRIDAYEWKVPVEAVGDREALANSLGMQELNALAEATDSLAVSAANANAAAAAAQLADQGAQRDAAMQSAAAAPREPEMKNVTPVAAPVTAAPVTAEPTPRQNVVADPAPAVAAPIVAGSRPVDGQADDGGSVPPVSAGAVAAGAASVGAHNAVEQDGAAPAQDATDPGHVDNQTGAPTSVVSSQPAAKATHERAQTPATSAPSTAANGAATAAQADAPEPATPARNDTAKQVRTTATGGTNGSNGRRPAARPANNQGANAGDAEQSARSNNSHKGGKQSRSKRRERRAAQVADRAHAPDDPGVQGTSTTKAPG
ncbi:MAG: heme biosynthesis HemY N-terminal domain-containing protein [Pseudomonadota bacterium]